MENNLNVIPIFFAVDDSYLPFLAVSLESLIENASKSYYYSIKILYTDISEENKKKINKYERNNVKIEFVDLNYYIKKVKDKLHTRDYYTKTTYFRLFIPDLYPQYNKALYLDSDIVVLGDISRLYNENIEGKLVAAAPDDVIQNSKIFQEYAEKVVGVSSYKKYFNAGVLLMNLDELRKFKFQEKFLYSLETIKFTVAQDQDYLNRMCKGRVKIVDTSWDKMPIYANGQKEELNIIHYNLGYKPWHFDNIMYEEYFWKYANKTEYKEEIRRIKENYTEEQRFSDREQFKNLEKLAQKESDCVGDDRRKLYNHYNFYSFGKDNSPNFEKYEERVKILQKIEDYERNGKFDIDVEDDPPTITLMPENVDYLSTKSTNKIKNKIAYKVAERFLNNLLRDNKLIIKEIKGIENLKKVTTGAIITCNHFNPFDSFAIESVFRTSGQHKTKKLYKVIREGNYTNFPGIYGFFFRHCNTLPLSSNKRTMVEFMKSVDIILEKRNFILIYPEQSMWWNYRKPKPLKDGAYAIATRNNVPIIPIFITMSDSEIIGEDGFPIQEYTINIGKPIYPKNNLSKKENINKMKDENFEVWKNIYEEFYKEPLIYTTKKVNTVEIH